MSIVRVCHLTHIYNKDTPFEKKAINDINLEIKEQSFLAIVGHIGSGKSTLVKHLNGLLKPSYGNVYINNKDIWEEKENIYKYRFKVGLVFQYPEYQLFEETVFKDIAFGPQNMELSQSEIEERVKWAVGIVGLSTDCLTRSPFELSGGQKRKVALAGVIAMDPDVLVLDEPTAGLDPKSKNLLLNNLKLYHKNRKNTVILISHNMDDVANFCDDIVVMNKSQIYITGKTNEVFSQIEKLKGVGIAPPTVTELFYILNKRGYELNNQIHTCEKASEYFLNLKNKLKNKS